MQYIGVDLHKSQFTTCHYDGNGGEQIGKYPFTDEGLDSFLKSVTCFDEIAVEAMGPANYFIRKVQPKVRKVVAVAPGKFPLVSESYKKTDKNDARSLAKCLAEGTLPLARTKDEAYHQVRSVISTRQIYVNFRRTMIVRLQSLLLRNGIIVPKDRLRFRKHRTALDLERLEAGDLTSALMILDDFEYLSNRIKGLEQEADKLASNLPGYETIMSVPGFGPVTGSCVLATIGDIRDFPTAPQLASYFGIVPAIKHSADKKYFGRITKRGNSLARSSLIQAAWMAQRQSPHLHAFYKRIQKRRGTAKAMVANGRKVLSILHMAMTRGWVFEDFASFKYREIK